LEYHEAVSRRQIVLGFALIAVVGLTAEGCGSSAASNDGGPPGEASCNLVITLSGDIGFQSKEGTMTCGTVNNTPSELLALFLPKTRSDVVAGIGVAIVGFTPGQTATGLSATVNVDDRDGRTFYALSCTADVSENTSLGAVDGGTRYRVSAHGQCSGPAIATGGTIDLTPFVLTTTALR
jgi:hypothetical protein